MSLVSDIKLIRTDTTLDLSQKAEKGMLPEFGRRFLYPSQPYPFSTNAYGNEKYHTLFGLNWVEFLTIDATYNSTLLSPQSSLILAIEAGAFKRKSSTVS